MPWDPERVSSAGRGSVEWRHPSSASGFSPTRARSSTETSGLGVQRRPQDHSLLRGGGEHEKNSRRKSADGRDPLMLANLLPPLFVCVIICTIWSVYTGLHLMPLLQVRVPPHLRREEDAERGFWQCVVSQVLTLQVLVCYARAMLTHPGQVPTSFESKVFREVEADGKTKDPLTREVKITGERRRCKWCCQYKPDRCHHCRQCGTCILKMDHHCPWIVNCVGFRNHKYFFLLVVYSVAICLFICATMTGTVIRSSAEEMAMLDRFLLVLGLMLTIIMGTMTTVFLGFHTYLLFTGTTTIEYCEKRAVALATQGLPGKSRSYDRGPYQNIVAVLGPQPLLWFFPTCPPEGDGTVFRDSTWKFDEDEVQVEDPEWTPQRPDERP